MATTPAASDYDDFPEWKKWVESQIRTALGRSVSRPALGVSSGNFEVNGGIVKVSGDGGISMVSTAGVEIFSARGQTSEAAGNGTPQPEVRMYRADGTPAFYMWDPFPDYDTFGQFWAWYDRGGNIVVGDDVITGRGLARPYMHYNIIDENGGNWVTPASTASFYDAHTVAGYVQNPWVEIAVTAIAPSTGAGEVQIKVDGTGEVVAGPTAIPAGTSVAPFYRFQVPDNIGIWSYQYFDVETRRVSGTGNIQSRVWSAYGVQT